MKYVLFVCTHNAGRSQMAQALFERDCTHDCRAESAGSEPARQIWPEVVQVMREGMVLPSLIDGFGETCAPTVIRDCADRVLDQYDHVPIRSHILTLATRQARECLSHERCELLETTSP